MQICSRRYTRKARLTGVSILFSIACLMAFFVRNVSAQTANATVSGLITDPSGSAVPQAAVVVTNTSTGVASKTESDSGGLYRVTSLVPGPYRISITKDGFKSSLKSDIQLHVQDAVTLDFSLQLGMASESVIVQGGQPLLQTQDSSLNTAVEGRTVQDMPLNGRNVLNLVSLVPGVVTQGSASGNPVGNQANGSANPQGWGNYQIGGGMANQSSEYIDGAPINTSYINAPAIIPTQDAIGEFRIVTNNVPPDYGRFAGGVVNLSTKSGTNALHGTAYEYIRNKVLNANNYFNNLFGLPRTNFTQNQYGVTVSGPVKQDKLFFLSSWEGFAIRTGVPTTTTVPTAAMRQGDLSELGVGIYDPLTTVQTAPGVYTRRQFSGNAIPKQRLDPTALAILQLFPEPNQPGVVNNYVNDPSSGGNSNQYNERADWAPNDTQRLFARYTLWKATDQIADAYGNGTSYGPESFTTNQAVLGDTYIINTTTVANLRLSYLRFVYDLLADSTGVDLSKFGPNYDALSSLVTWRQNPVANITGVTNGQWGGQDTMILNGSNDIVLSGNLTKTVARHTLTFGGEVRKKEWGYTQDGSSGGNFNFNAGFTAQNPLDPGNSGAGIASFLLGYAANGSQSNVIKPDALQWYGGVYASDVFQLNSRLTVNLGLRWEQPGSFYEKHDRLSVLLPDATDPLSTSTGLNLTGQVALVNSPDYKSRVEQDLHWNLFSPRVGFAFKLSERTVVRGGYGISYLPNDLGFNACVCFAPTNSTTTTMASTLDGGLTPNATLTNPFPNGILQPVGRDTSRLSELEGTSITAVEPNNSYPNVQQWNANVEQQFGSSTAVEIGYAGSKGTHLPLNTLGLDQLSPQYYSMGSALLGPVANPFLGKISAASGQLGTASTLPAGTLLTPYPQYLSVSAASPFLAASSYNSLQVKVQQQFGSGGTLMGSYTWAKLISNTDTLTGFLENAGPGGNQNAYDLAADRSLAGFDVPQNFVLSYVTDLPFGKGRHWLGTLHGTPQALIGGWSLTGVTTFRSGFPLALAAQPTTLSTYFGAGTPRPNIVASCTKAISGSAQSRLNEWFNTSCFTQPDTFGFGNENREDAQLRAAGVANWDVGVYKSTPLRDRFNVQFRAEAFNLANRVQFAPPATTLGVPQFGTVTGQVNLPRVLQFSLRLNY